MKNKPPYAITSVDNALRLATVLQLEGTLTVTEAAERLGVARSTAHRLLGMLCYRDFAVQGEDRAYYSGPVLAASRRLTATSARLRVLALPHLAELTGAVGETSNLTVLSGSLIRFLASVEGPQVLRVGSREGMAFPAHLTSAGMVMLAELSREELEAYHRQAQDADTAGDLPTLATLRQQLAGVRSRGFAINNGRTEDGIVAIGMAVIDPHGGLAGISLALPSARFTRDAVPDFIRHMHGCRTAIERDLGTAATMT